jgi:hypothetical protein
MGKGTLRFFYLLAHQTLKSLWQDLVAAMKWAELDEARLQRMKTEKMLGCYRSSLSLNVDNLSTHSNLLLALSYYPQCTSKK